MQLISLFVYLSDAERLFIRKRNPMIMKIKYLFILSLKLFLKSVIIPINLPFF